MSSNVVNEAKTLAKAKSRFAGEIKGQAPHSSSEMGESSEDYTSYKIIEMLKRDNLPIPSNKRRKTSESQDGEFEVLKIPGDHSAAGVENADQSDGCSLITDNIEVPKYDENK